DPAADRLPHLRHRQHHTDAYGRHAARHVRTFLAEEVVPARAGTVQRSAVLCAGRGHGGGGSCHRIVDGTRRRAVRLLEVLSMPAFPFKPTLAILTFLGMLAAFPRVSRDLRSVDRSTVEAIFDFPPEPVGAGEIEDVSMPHVADARLVDPSG